MKAHKEFKVLQSCSNLHFFKPGILPITRKGLLCNKKKVYIIIYTNQCSNFTVTYESMTVVLLFKVNDSIPTLLVVEMCARSKWQCLGV